jgi:hypothetical protein
MTDDLYSVTYGSGSFVAVGGSTRFTDCCLLYSYKILTSIDGESWALANSGSMGVLYSVAYGNGRFVAAGMNGMILTSLADNIPVIQPIPEKRRASSLKIATGKNGIIVWAAPYRSDAPWNVAIFNTAGKEIYSGTRLMNNGRMDIPVSVTKTGKYLISMKGNKSDFSSSFFIMK